jgi:Crp-like helix-turn-helix domain
MGWLAREAERAVLQRWRALHPLPVLLSHAGLAAWIGSCRHTVDRALRLWRDRRLISTTYRTIITHDRQALGRIAGIRVSPRRPLPRKPHAGCEHASAGFVKTRLPGFR